MSNQKEILKKTVNLRDGLKVGLEQITFVVHHFSMLNRSIVQQSVQFHCFVGRSAVLVLSRILADPEVHIVQQSVTVRLFVDLI